MFLLSFFHHKLELMTVNAGAKFEVSAGYEDMKGDASVENRVV